MLFIQILERQSTFHTMLEFKAHKLKKTHLCFSLRDSLQLLCFPLSLKLCFFLTDKLPIALQITRMPQSLPRNQGAQMCVLDVGKQCTQQRRLSEEAT